MDAVWTSSGSEPLVEASRSIMPPRGLSQSFGPERYITLHHQTRESSDLGFSILTHHLHPLFRGLTLHLTTPNEPPPLILPYHLRIYSTTRRSR